MKHEEVLVVGAGFGGLAAALSLASRGRSVRVLESAPEVGGKARAVNLAGRRIEVGPTVLTLLPVFEALFAEARADWRGYLELRRQSPIARHFFGDGTALDLTSSVDENQEAIARLAGRREADGYQRYAAYCERIFEVVQQPFLRGPRPTFGAALRALPKLTVIDPLRSMARAVGGFFQDPRLRQLFCRYATYAGGLASAAPAALNVIAHVERLGVWRPEGGMSAVAAAVARRLRELGGQIELGVQVRRIEVEAGRATAVTVEGGRRIAARAVIFAADAGALASGLLGPEAAGAVTPTEGGLRRRSLSALTFAAVSPVGGAPLSHHNVFFSPDGAKEERQLLRGALPDEPTVYVCAQDRGGPTGGAAEALFSIVNAPAGREFTPLEIERCLRRAMERLTRAGLHWSALDPTHRETPGDHAQRWPGSAGAIYGPAPAGPLAPFRRAGSRSRIEGLYLAGGTVHPGAGVPLAVISGMLAAEQVAMDLASISARRTVATAGGTSTPSATTAPTPSP